MTASPALAPTPSFNARARAAGWPVSCDPELQFEDESLRAILGIWQSARGRRMVPRRADITMRVLGEHLHETLFVDRVQMPDGVRRYRFRFLGRALAYLSGDHTGKFVDAVVPPQYVGGWYLSYDAVIERRVPLRFLWPYRAPDGRYFAGESLVAPLGDGMGNPVSLLTSAAFTPVPEP